jgi:hypothetical protein
MCRLKTRNVVFRKSLVARRLHLLACDAERRIVGDAPLLQGPFEHRSRGVQ